VGASSESRVAVQPILVTGSHRSGTTWVGRMLEASGHLAYLSEPLNPYSPGPLLSLRPSLQYTYICEENEAGFLSPFRHLVAVDYPLGNEVLAIRSARDAGRLVKRRRAFSRARSLGEVALIKDPFAVFSARWFAERLGCQVLVLVRHPAAVVSSLKRLGWRFNFRHLLRQPLLLRDWLEPHRAAIVEALRSPDDIVAQGSLLWRLIYGVIDEYRTACPEFVVVRHEDLSLEPLGEFARLYESLGLPLSEEARRRIADSTATSNARELDLATPKAIRLDSRAAVHNWRRRLTAEEVERIRNMTGELGSRFYDDAEWTAEEAQETSGR
jgi:Sulfotransferase domain